MRRQIVCYVIMVTLTRHFPYNAHDECVVWMVVAFFIFCLQYGIHCSLFWCYMPISYGVTWCMDAFTKTLPMFETYFKVCTCYQWPTIQCCCIMGWINLEAYKKLTTERPKNIYLQSNIVKIKHISNICRTTIKRGQIGQRQMRQIWRA